MMNVSCILLNLYPCFDVFFCASIFVDCTAQVYEQVQWLSFQGDGVVFFVLACIILVDSEDLIVTGVDSRLLAQLQRKHTYKY